MTCAIAIAALLLSACGNSNAKGPTPTETIDVELTDFMISPMNMNAHAGTVRFHVHNDGKSPHNFNIANPTKVGSSKDLAPGQSDELTVTLNVGTYQISCTEPGHASLGMKGTLSVA